MKIVYGPLVAYHTVIEMEKSCFIEIDGSNSSKNSLSKLSLTRILAQAGFHLTTIPHTISDGEINTGRHLAEPNDTKKVPYWL